MLLPFITPMNFTYLSRNYWYQIQTFAACLCIIGETIFAYTRVRPFGIDTLSITTTLMINSRVLTFIDVYKFKKVMALLQPFLYTKFKGTCPYWQNISRSYITHSEGEKTQKKRSHCWTVKFIKLHKCINLPSNV